MNFDHLKKHFQLNDPVDKGTFITQGFGRDRTSANILHWYESMGLQGHNGVDYGVRWKPVYAVIDGTVISSGEDISGGRLIKYETAPISNEHGDFKLQFIYYHLDSMKVKSGDKVKRGQDIGVSGNTGKYTTGAHLHFGMKPYFKKDGKWQRDYNNGYKGAIDPLPFMISQGNKPTKPKEFKSMVFLKSENDPRVFGQLGGQYIWLDMTFEQFNQNFPNNEVIELSESEFNKLPKSSLKINV